MREYKFMLLTFLILLIIGLNIKAETGVISFLPSNAQIQALNSGSAGIVSGLQNPATIALISKKQISATYSTYFIDTLHLTLSGILHFQQYSAGVSFLYLGYGDFPSYDVSGIKVGNKSAGYSSCVCFSLAKALSDLFIGAGNIKIMIENIAENSATSFAVDLGILKQNLFLDDLSVAAVIQNLGIGPKFKNTSESLDLNFKLSLLYPLIFPKNNFGLKFMSDINYPKSGFYNIGIGSEFNYILSSITELFLRVGYKIPQYQSFFSSFSFGLGVKYTQFQLDYALTPGEYLGYINKVTLTLRF